MATPPVSDDELRRTLDVLAAHGGDTLAAASALRLHRNTLYRRLKRAALRGLDQSVPRVLPIGQVIKGVSTLYDRNGQVAATWVKTEAEREARIEAFLDDIRAAFEDYRGRAEVVPGPAEFDADLLTVVPLVDLHLGLRAWAFETGEDYDLAIADRVIRECLSALFAQSAPSAETVILGLGDLTHADNNRAETEKSRHRLDVDSRHHKVRSVAARLLIWAVEMALDRSDRVTVRLLGGNHDPETAPALAFALALFFEGNPRVTVDLDQSLFFFKEWGLNLIAATHGHACTMKEFPGRIAALAPRAWGRTVFRRGLTAHIHHESGIERDGVAVESLGTPTAKDSYHAGKGFSSVRQMYALRFHKTRGPRGRTVEAIAPTPGGEVAA